jgi:hypothetical protein
MMPNTIRVREAVDRLNGLEATIIGRLNAAARKIGVAGQTLTPTAAASTLLRLADQVTADVDRLRYDLETGRAAISADVRESAPME